MADSNTPPNLGLPEQQEAYQQALLIIKQQNEILEFNKAINSDFTGFLKTKKQLLDMDNDIFLREKLIAEEEAKGHADVVAFLKKQLEFDTKTLIIQQQMLKNTNLFKIGINSLVNSSLPSFMAILGDVVEYINKADAAYKDLNKSIGLSGLESGILRENLISASKTAASLGINFEDLTKIQEAYTGQMGTAVLLGKESLENISLIAAGTMMGAEQAGIMSGKFQNMGKSVSSIKDFYEATINESEKMGVSANEVIKKINDNLDKSQKYVFKGGINGLKEMAMYATKFNISMEGVFNAMDKSNSLEGAVDMVAQLQVIGGRFAQANPFKLLFESRNDTVAFTKDIQSMTRGMATFNQSTGEIQIAAGDLNRLKLAADATGISYEALIAQAKRGEEINMVDRMIPNITGKQKDFIESIAEMQKGGTFTVQMPNGMGPKDIRDLTVSDIKALQENNTTLQDQAKNAMTFDKLMINTINEMKSGLLPILKNIDSFLQMLNESVPHSLLKWSLGIGTGLLALGSGFKAFQIITDPIKLLFAKIGDIRKNITPDIPRSEHGFFETKSTKGPPLNIGKEAIDDGSNVVGNNVSKEFNEKKTGGKFLANTSEEEIKNTEAFAKSEENVGKSAGGAWKNMLAFGAAVAEIGAGIWLATEGIAGMANAFKGLNVTQLQGVEVVLGELVVGMGGIAVAGAFAKSEENVGKSAGGAWKNMLAFGAAVAEIGAGIWLATEGIAGMANAFKGLNTSQILGVTTAIGVLGGSFAAIIALAPGLAAAGVELIPFGIAIGLIGVGVGIAATGIGFMAKGFGDLFESISKAASPDVVDNLGRLMLSLGALSGEALVFANPLTWLGLKSMSSSLEDIGDKLKDANFQNLSIGATSFENIASAIDKINDKKLDKLIQVSEGLSGIGSIAAIFGSLANSLGDGIEVKFSKDKVNLEVNVTAEMDGTQIGRKISKEVALSIERSKKGSVG